MTKERIEEYQLPSKAIILAGGRGERMNPISDFLPKILLPILDKPLIIHHLERLEKAQVQQVAIAIEPGLGEMVVKAVEAGYKGDLEVSFVMDTRYRGTGEGTYLCRDLMESSSFFLCLGDRYQEGEEIFTNFRQYLRKDEEGLAAIVKIQPHNIYQNGILSGTNVCLNEDNRALASLVRFPHRSRVLGNWFLTGIFILRPSFWEVLEKVRGRIDSKKSFSKTLVLEEMIKQGAQIGYIKEKGLVFNINTLQDFLFANLYLAKKRGIL